MAEEKILTLHPEGKNGVNISKTKYDTIKDYILNGLNEGPRIWDDLADEANEDLKETFDGKVIWYFVTVKLDLEARGMIERVPKTSPHEIRLIVSR